VVSVAQTEEPDGAGLRIEVADRGLGLSPADVPHMFEWYSRGSNVVSTIPDTGLGLASVRQRSSSMVSP
jgi:signal transduction histidine kinase